ncbi:MAG TPA: TatD family deoxyribonuclease [Spirochaetes bacterium]|nr:TatD family deoxyribonuclease [Spirochaetota bacterium]
MNYIDSHAHFDLCAEEGMDTASLVRDMAESGVGRAVQISIEPAGFAWSRDFAADNRASGVLFSLGIHPSSRADESDLAHLSDLTGSVLGSDDAPLLFGVGETGLDYYRMRRPREEQMRSFEFQAELAKKTGLPLIVHSRDAMEDTLGVLKKIRPDRGIMHCFPGDSDDARSVLDLGFHLSFAGNLTYPKAAALHDAAGFVPLDRVLFETDAPFLAPVPLRGKKNMPRHVVHTYRFFAGLRKISVEELAERVQTTFAGLAGR